MLFFPDAHSVSPVWRICVSAQFCSLAHYNMSQMTCLIHLFPCDFLNIWLLCNNRNIPNITYTSQSRQLSAEAKILALTHAAIFQRGPEQHDAEVNCPSRKKYSIYPTLLSWQSHRWRGFSTVQYHTVWLCDFPLWQCVILLHVPLVVRWSSMNG